MKRDHTSFLQTYTKIVVIKSHGVQLKLTTSKKWNSESRIQTIDIPRFNLFLKNQKKKLKIK